MATTDVRSDLSVKRPAQRPGPDRATRHGPEAGSRLLGTEPSRSRVLTRVQLAGLEERFERDMRALATDILGVPGRDELSDDCAAWVASTTATASASLLRSTFLVLVRELDRALEDAPARVVRGLGESRARLDVGLE